jgi:hypothetical protein
LRAGGPGGLRGAVEEEAHRLVLRGGAARAQVVVPVAGAREEDRADEQAAGAAGAQALHLGGGATPAPDDTLLRFKRLFSPMRPRFHVARVLADRARFTDLVSRWEAQAGRPARWLLGYREPIPSQIASS